jgi:hypothetical protein
MKSKVWKLRQRQRRQLRFLLRGSFAMSVVTYAVLIILKLRGDLPHPIYSWWFIAIGPLAYFLALIGVCWLACSLDLMSASRDERQEFDRLE